MSINHWFSVCLLPFIPLVRRLLSLRQPENQARIWRRRATKALWLVIVTIPLVLVCIPYKTLTPTGPYSVASVRYSYTDKKRTEQYSSISEYRRVNVVFWYPENAEIGETYPLVVFSHGGLGIETSNQSL